MTATETSNELILKEKIMGFFLWGVVFCAFCGPFAFWDSARIEVFKAPDRALTVLAAQADEAGDCAPSRFAGVTLPYEAKVWGISVKSGHVKVTDSAVLGWGDYPSIDPKEKALALYGVTEEGKRAAILYPLRRAVCAAKARP